MPSIIFYDFWQNKEKRKPIIKLNSFDDIQIVEKNKTLDLKNQVIILKNQNYRILSIDRQLKKNVISDHHTTKDTIIYEIMVETVVD